MVVRTMKWMALVGMVCGAVACGGTQPESDPMGTQAQGVGEACGGFAGLQCPRGLVCVDDPSDGCDPNNGGRDCIGICQEDTAPSCDNPDRYYVSTDPDRCAVIRYACPPPGAQNASKTQFFGDACGCGCETPR